MPCAYYSNSTATFHCLLEGDLVFKLNPGPSGRPILTIVSVRDEPGQTHNNGHNSKNLSCVQPAKLRPTNMSQRLLSFCLMNTRSVRNKTAMLMDYICDLKADLYAITETWLTENDASVRVELIPDGYNLLDQARVGRRGGGTGLLYRNDLRVKKVESGEENSFEFSEWIISSIGHDIRLFIIYRPPYSDEHQVPTSQSTPSVISGEGFDELARDYNNTLSALVDRHAPLKSKRIRSRPSVPWHTAEINAATKIRRKAERRWRRTGLHEDFAAFKAQRNRVTYLMNVARKEFYTDFIAANSSDQRKLFRAAKKLLA